MLIECKPSHSELSINHASQLFRYFATTEARVAVLTNGVIYKFFADIDSPNKMDDKPFFSFDIEAIRKSDIRTLQGFMKHTFDIDQIVQEAGNLKLKSLVYKELLSELQEPSDDFVKIIAAKVSAGRLTQGIRDNIRILITDSFSTLVRDRVNERLTSALSASNPAEEEVPTNTASDAEIVTTEDEIAGFQIVRAIGARLVDPKRIIMRDAKSYCAVLLDDNNRKTICRLHFNSATSRHFGTFAGKDETRIQVVEPTDIFQHEAAVMARISELLGA
jgi:hypothetical protein